MILNELLNKLNEEDFDFKDIETGNISLTDDQIRCIGWQAFLDMINSSINRNSLAAAIKRKVPSADSDFLYDIVFEMIKGIGFDIAHYIEELE